MKTKSPQHHLSPQSLQPEMALLILHPGKPTVPSRSTPSPSKRSSVLLLSKHRTQSLSSLGTVPPIPAMISERLLATPGKRRLLDVDLSRIVRKTERKTISVPTPQQMQTPLIDFSKGIKLFHKLFGNPEKTRKMTVKAKVKLPQRFTESPQRGKVSPWRVGKNREPFAPLGKTATTFAFKELVVQDTTIARRSSAYRLY